MMYLVLFGILKICKRIKIPLYNKSFFEFCKIISSDISKRHTLTKKALL